MNELNIRRMLSPCFTCGHGKVRHGQQDETCQGCRDGEHTVDSKRIGRLKSPCTRTLDQIEREWAAYVKARAARHPATLLEKVIKKRPHLMGQKVTGSNPASRS